MLLPFFPCSCPPPLSSPPYVSPRVYRLQLSQKDPDEIEVERDFTIRKKIKGIYNQTAEAFDTALDFRNYEETVEDVIYNLVNNIDVEATNSQVELYQRGHLQQVRGEERRGTDKH